MRFILMIFPSTDSGNHTNQALILPPWDDPPSSSKKNAGPTKTKRLTVPVDDPTSPTYQWRLKTAIDSI